MKLAILALCLIGVMADCTDIEIGWLSRIGLVKETEVSVANYFETRIQKTSLHEKGLLSVNEVLVNFSGLNLRVVSISTEAGGRKDNLPGGDRWGRFLASLKKFEDSFDGFSASFILGSFSEPIDDLNKIVGWFLPCIGVLNINSKFFPGLYSAIETCIAWADPRALGGNHIVMGNLGVLAHGCSFFIRSLGLFGNSAGLLTGDFGKFGIGSDEFGGLFRSSVHFVALLGENMSLVKDPGGRRDNKNEGQPLSKGLSAILALFLCSISLSLTTYGVYQSRKIGGWAALIVVAGVPFFWAGTVFFLSGVLGWSGGLNGWSF